MLTGSGLGPGRPMRVRVHVCLCVRNSACVVNSTQREREGARLREVTERLSG